MEQLQWTRSQPPTGTNLALKGAVVRMAAGTSLIVTGVLEIIMTSVLIVVPMGICDVFDYFALGIWGGLFAIATGCLGLVSKRGKSVVIAYMVLSIIQAVISGSATFFASFQIACAANHYSQRYSGDYAYSFRYKEVLESLAGIRLHLALYILLCLIYVFQTIASIIGASFTCTAIRTTGNPQSHQVVMYQPSQMPIQTTRDAGAQPAETTATSHQIPLNIHGLQDNPTYEYSFK